MDMFIGDLAYSLNNLNMYLSQSQLNCQDHGSLRFRNLHNSQKLKSSYPTFCWLFLYGTTLVNLSYPILS